MSLTIEQYSQKSYVVRGETRENKKLLADLKCKYNGSLSGGPGWIFQATRLEEIKAGLGELLSSEEIESNPRINASFTFEAMEKGTKFFGESGSECSLVEHDSVSTLTLVDDEGKEHIGHYVYALKKWLVQNGEQLELIEKQ